MVLGARPVRGISLSHKIVSNAIFMPCLSPSKLAVPTQAGTTFEFTAGRGDVTVGQFKQIVLENTDGQVKDFDLSSKDIEVTDDMSMEEFTRSKF